MVDSLKDELIKVKTLCDTHNKAIFYGALKDDEEKVRDELIWNGSLSDSKSLDGFLESFIKSSSSILIISGKKNNLELTVDLIETYLKIQKPDNEQFIRESFDILNRRKDHVIHFKLSYLIDGYLYSFSSISEWKNNYRVVAKIQTHLLRDIETEKRLKDKSRLTEIAKKIVEDKEYLAATDSHERRAIAIQVAQKLKAKNEDESWSISLIAEQIYMKEVKVRLEKELKDKIKALKSKGYTKVKIRGELGITQRTLEKYYDL